MNFTGLSLDQAPPLDAPARFFITAPLFGMIGAVAIFVTDPASLMNRYSTESIGIVHLFTVGMFAMVMFGALQQMLPVLAGVSLPKARIVAIFSHLGIVTGVLSMATGLYESSRVLLLLAEVGLGAGSLLLLTAIAIAMRKVAFFTPTVKAMMFAALIAFMIALLGLHLLGSHAFGVISGMQVVLADVHSVWSIFGFAGVLIIGVAFQVLPMFYVTPPFKASITVSMVPLIVLSLLVWLVVNLFSPHLAWIGSLLVTLSFMAFSAMIVKKFYERRRPVSDVTVYYWHLGAALLASGLVMWQVNTWTITDYMPIVGVLIGGFILSIISGMLYKIVPFLVWFHLNGQGHMRIPTMSEMIDKRVSWAQFVLFVITVALFIAAYWSPSLIKVGAITLFVSMGLLESGLLIALRIYVVTRKRPPEFSFGGDVD